MCTQQQYAKMGENSAITNMSMSDCNKIVRLTQRLNCNGFNKFVCTLFVLGTFKKKFFNWTQRLQKVALFLIF